MNLNELLKKEKIISVIKNREYWFPPENYPKNPLNLLGLQVFRYLYERARSVCLRACYNELDTNIANSAELYGCGVLSNYFSGTDFLAIREAYYDVMNRTSYNYDNLKTILVHESPYAKRVAISEEYLRSEIGIQDHSANLLFEKFGGNSFKSIASDVIAYNVVTSPTVELESIRTDNDGTDSPDHNSQWHVDRHADCVKIFFYINDHDESNCTYEYLKGSHKFSLARVVYEYYISALRFLMMIRTNFTYKKYYPAMRKINRLPPYFEDSLNIVCSPISAPENSIVFSNNCGFHRRGSKLMPKMTREQVNLNFYRVRKHYPWYLIKRILNIK